MPHTSRPCNPPYGIRFREILADSWSHWSICQSRSHWMTPVDRIELRPGNPRFFQEIQMQGDPFNILIGTSTNDRQKSSRVRAMSRPSTKPKPGNRRFSQKSSRFTEFRGHMGPALIDHPGIAENLTSTFVANLLRRDLVERARREHKYHQNRHAGFTTATTMTICKNLNLIKIRRTLGKGSILDTKEGPCVKFELPAPWI